MTHGLIAHAHASRDMAPHIGTLARLAKGAHLLVEFGVRTGVSTWALLDVLAPDGTLWSWDDGREGRIDGLVPRRVVDDPRWHFTDENCLFAEVPGTPDLLFTDTTHEYHQTIAELRLADTWQAPRIVLHDWNLDDVQDAVRGFCDRFPYRIEGIEPSDWGMVWLRRS